MKKRNFFVLALLPLTMGCATGMDFSDYLDPNPENYPLSDQVTKIELKNIPMRVEILDNDTIRFEYKYYSPIYDTYNYLDRDTFLVPFRHKYQGIDNKPEVVEQTKKCTITFNKGRGDETIIEIDTSNLDCRNFANITIKRNGEVIYSSGAGLTNSDINDGNLPTPGLDDSKSYRLIDYPRILVPSDGYNTLSAQKHPELATTGGYEIQDQKDLYIMIHNGDATKLRKLYNQLAGPSEMVRLASLGAWDSRYYPYNERTVQLEVDNYHDYELPLDNFVIDTDWRTAVSGAGYDVNTDLFPDMRGTLAKLHKQNIEVMFNDHPEPVVKGMNVLGGQEIYNRNYNLQKILNLGLDTWWYDRNWSTALISPTIKDGVELIRHETWGDYIFNDVTKQYYQSISGSKEKYRRPTTMTNLVDVRNGLWEGTKDTASHRYSLQWTGDTVPEQLPTEINNVVKAGNNCVPYMSSDLAGHTGNVASNYYYARWIQYGALSPIFRIHCTRDLPIHCQPWYRLEDNDAWEADEEAVTRFKKYIDMRYRLMPLFYQLANENYETGLPIARALAFNYPTDKNVGGIEDEWMLGNNILFAPLNKAENMETLLTDDAWTVQYHNLKKDDTGHYPLNNASDDNWTDPTNSSAHKDFDYTGSIPARTLLSLDMTSNLPSGVQREGYVAKITGKFTPTKDCQGLHLTGAVDDGIYIMIGGDKFTDEWKDGGERRFDTHINLTKGTQYDITIYYYQNTGGGVMKLYGEGERMEETVTATEVKDVYLPKGEWYDPFHDVYYDSDGQWTSELADESERTYNVDQNAIFIRLGGMIPLVDNAPTTKDINWRKLYYDIYPSIDATKNDNSYFYEDDYDSVGYQLGEYRKSDYSYKLTEDTKNKTRTITIDLGGANGSFDGDFEVTDREYVLHIHNLEDFKNENISSVTIDGTPADYALVEGDVSNMPFTTQTLVNNNDAITQIEIPFNSVRKSHKVVITYRVEETR